MANKDCINELGRLFSPWTLYFYCWTMWVEIGRRMVLNGNLDCKPALCNQEGHPRWRGTPSQEELNPTGFLLHMRGFRGNGEGSLVVRTVLILLPLSAKCSLFQSRE